MKLKKFIKYLEEHPNLVRSEKDVADLVTYCLLKYHSQRSQLFERLSPIINSNLLKSLETELSKTFRGADKYGSLFKLLNRLDDPSYLNIIDNTIVNPNVISEDSDKSYVINDITADEFSMTERELWVRGYGKLYIGSDLLPSEFRKLIDHKFSIKVTGKRFRFIGDHEKFFKTYCVSNSYQIHNALKAAAKFVENSKKNKVRHILRNLRATIGIDATLFKREDDSDYVYYDFDIKPFLSSLLTYNITREDVFDVFYFTTGKIWNSNYVDYSLRPILKDIIDSTLPEYFSCTDSLVNIFPKLSNFVIRLSLPYSSYLHASLLNPVPFKVFYDDIDDELLWRHLIDNNHFRDFNFIVNGKNYISIDLKDTKAEVDRIMALMYEKYPRVRLDYFNSREYSNIDYLRSIYNIKFNEKEDFAHLFFLKNTTHVPWLWLQNYMAEKPDVIFTSFIDNNRCYSDDYAWSSKPSFETYMTVEGSEETHWRISLYPHSEGYSRYSFAVLPKRLKVALFFIWAYFSSGIPNKRYNFFLQEFFSEIGIFSFWKGSAMWFSKERGFC